MCKKTVLLLVLLILGSSAFLRAEVSRPEPAGNRPNFVFILIDDMGWKDVGFMGSKFYETPNIDKLAGEGMVFTNAYSNAANCAPTRASLLTGQYTPRHGVYTVGNSTRGRSSNRRLIPVVNDTTLDSRHVTIAEALKKGNYVSASMGKWHMGNPPELGPVEQGFDLNVGGHAAGGPYTGKKYFSPYKNKWLGDGPDGQYLTDRLSDEAVKFIEINKDKPFFLYLAHYAVHAPLMAKDKLKDYYKSKNTRHGPYKKPDHNNSTYAAMIHSVDEGVGRIMKKLKELSLDERTVVVFFSDNGGAGFATDMYPLRGAKGMFYEGGIRVPMLVRWKGSVKPASVCSEPVMGVDFFPTFLDLAGIDQPAGKILDGKSIVPLLKGADKLNREAVFWHFPAYLQGGDSESRDKIFRTRPVSVIRKGSWKLLLFLEEWILDCNENADSASLLKAVELYNLKNDLGEQNNLASSNKQKRDELLADLLTWRKSLGIEAGEMKLNPKYNTNKQ